MFGYHLTTCELAQIHLADTDLCGGKYSGFMSGFCNAKGVNLIADAIRVSTLLTSVDIGYNSISLETALKLVAIFNEKPVVFVGLADCYLGSEGAQAVADHIQASASLTDIDLSDNNLTKHGKDMSGIEVMASAIRVNASLRSMNLVKNDIDDATASLLLGMKEEKHSLVSFCGLKLDAARASFWSGLTQSDAKLLAPEIAPEALADEHRSCTESD